MDEPTREELAREARRLLSALLPRKDSLTPRERLAIPSQIMPAQPVSERMRNMNEVALGYTPEQARVEALRCLQCRKAPCVEGCPVAIDIPGFLRATVNGDFRRGIEIIKANNLLPAICGRVCPQEEQCQKACTVGKALDDTDCAVSIGRVERFLADWEREHGGRNPPPVKSETGRRVAVIGSGPAGLTVAADVRREGHAVTLFEAFHKPGGVMMYGIPEFRLPKAIVQAEIETLQTMGVDLVTNFVVGRTRTLRDLLEQDGYDAAFIGTGAGLPKFMHIPGENLIGVFSANEYLTRANLMRAFDREHADTPIAQGRIVAVLGGGNVAMDAARTAVRLGAQEVHLIYRRTEKEMPARIEEVRHAKEEGVILHVLQNGKRILGDENGRVKAVECLRYELGEPDASGRPRPVEIPGSEFILPFDLVIVAIGENVPALASEPVSKAWR